MIGASFAALLVIAQAPASLDSAVRAAASRGFHGNVLIVQRGQVLLHQGYGLAREAPRTPFTPATLVQIGSNVKDMTRLAIYQLAEQGRLRLSDPVTRFFQNVPPDKAGITVQQLLDHRAGLGLGVSGGDNIPLSRDELLSRVWSRPLEAPPGTREIYSNTGYSLLAAIVEQLSGLPFDAYVARFMLDSLGMRQTGSFAPRFDRARVAHGYAGGRDIGTVLDQPRDADGHQYQLRGNGGYLSTLADMRTFYDGLRAGRLLRDPGLRSRLINFDDPGVYAGSDRVSFFLFAHYPGPDVQLYIASNHQEYMGNRLMNELLPLLGIRMGPGGPGGPGVEIVTADGPGEGRAAITGPLMPIPGTGPGRTVTEYLEAYATGDTSVMRRFFTERGMTTPDGPQISTRLERYLQMRGNLGNLTVRGSRPTPGGDGFIVVATAANGEELQLTFLVEQEAPYRLRGIRVEAGN